MLIKCGFDSVYGTKQNYISLYKFCKKYNLSNVNTIFQIASKMDIQTQ